ncbi:hypothetical protein V6N13_069688 [Hibiscus sabdariffa]|uniref:B3 domain-containing protein n=1 Tax=Hibiscus sabdariffa TaxID=183260 RepID=A0ABR2PHB7_9ROSI
MFIEMTKEMSADDFDHIQVDPSCGRFGCLLLIADFELERWPKSHDSHSGHGHGDFKGSRCNARQPRSLCKQEKVGFNFKSNKKAGVKPKRKLKEDDDDDDGEGEAAMKPKPKRNKKQQPLALALRPMPTPDLPHNFRRHILGNMGGSALMIQKTLFFSDVNPTASRFFVPFSQVKTHDFLTGTEAQSLAGKNPMQVRLLEPCMKETTLTFNRPQCAGRDKHNKLEEGNVVQLWSFRVNSELCFALVKVGAQTGN